jgi:small subunit ribosomal protein S6e
MVEFKVVINDTKNGKSHQVQVSGHHANSLIGKKIGDEVDGIFISLPGYKLQVTGGFKPKEKGLRKKKSIRGNTVNQDIVQINMKVTKHSSKPIDKLINIEKKDEGEKKEEQ